MKRVKIGSTKSSMSVFTSRFPRFVPPEVPMCLHLDCSDSLNSRNCIFESFSSKFYLFESFCLEFNEIPHCSNALKMKFFINFPNFTLTTTFERSLNELVTALNTFKVMNLLRSERFFKR